MIAFLFSVAYNLKSVFRNFNKSTYIIHCTQDATTLNSNVSLENFVWSVFFSLWQSCTHVGTGCFVSLKQCLSSLLFLQRLRGRLQSLAFCMPHSDGIYRHFDLRIFRILQNLRTKMYYFQSIQIQKNNNINSVCPNNNP